MDGPTAIVICVIAVCITLVLIAALASGRRRFEERVERIVTRPKPALPPPLATVGDATEPLPTISDAPPEG
jgi:hypothetical protein